MTERSREDRHPFLVALEEFQQAMAADIEPPTDAELRAAVRDRPLRELLMDLYALNEVTELAERLRSTAVTWVRVDDEANDEALASHLEITPRTLVRNYPRPGVTIRQVQGAKTLELYERRTGQASAQPLVLQFDLETGELSVFPFPEVSPDARPEGVDTGVLLWWDAPLLTPQGANTLMRRVKPLARRLRFGADLDQDKAGRTHATLDQDAAQASEEIRALCEQMADDSQALREIDAADFFGPYGRTVSEYDLTFAKTGDQIELIAENAENNALGDGLILLGAAEHLRRAVESLEVDTQLVLAVMEGSYTGDGQVLEYVEAVEYPGLNVPEINAWVNDQQPLLEESDARWIAVTFDAIETSLPHAVFEVDEDTARGLARAMDTES